VTAPELRFSTAAPLTTTRTTHETHQAAARSRSREVHHSVGQGSQLFLFARTWTERQGGRRTPAVSARHHPAKGLTLRDLAGRLLLDVERETRARREGDPWAGCNVAVDPGAYRLRVETPKWGPLEQIVVATAGWQTQVFLLQDDYGEGSTPAFRPDLARASILLARLGQGFEPNRDILRLAELARQGLANGRVVVSPADLNRMLRARSKSPMLGIYGAHALLGASKPDRTKLRTVVHGLRDLVGRHPDVDALWLRLYGRLAGEEGAFSVPPMLLSSWSIVVSKAMKRPQLVPAGSLASRMSPHLWGSGPWLIWLGDRVEAATPTEPSQSMAETAAKLAEVSEQLAADDWKPAARADLSDLESAVLSHVARVRQPDRQPPEAAAAGWPPGTATVERLATALNLPPSALQATVQQISQKLSRSRQR
jgi:hypothetical protein